VVEPGARLHRRTRIGAGCRVGAGAILRDAQVGHEVEVRPYTVVEEAKVGAGSVVTKDVPGGALAVERAPLVVKEGWVAARAARKQMKGAGRRAG
jgi:bifunctional UDP-N-acetylglucosamine pyrophosphorylase/glucosamine-1-phosphate N-acetyltransferase